MLDGLTDFLNPQPQAPAPAQADPALKSEWDGWLSNPKNRAAVLSFGLGLMTPTWGSSFANAVGGAAESYGAVEKMQQDEAIRQEGVNRSQSNLEAERNFKREINTADNEAAMARTKYSADAATNRITAKTGGYSKAAQTLFNKTYETERKRLMEPDILAPGYDPDAPLPSEEEAAAMATDAAVRAADAFEARFGKGASAGGAGASNSQIPAETGGGGDSAPAGEGPPAANVGATNNSTNGQGTPSPNGDGSIDASTFVQQVEPRKVDALLANPKADEYLAKYGLNSAMVRQAKAQREARNWLLQLGVGMPQMGQTPGVATPTVRGPGTGQVK